MQQDPMPISKKSTVVVIPVKDGIQEDGTGSRDRRGDGLGDFFKFDNMTISQKLAWPHFIGREGFHGLRTTRHWHL